MLFNKRCPHCGAFPRWFRILLPGSALHHWRCDNCDQPLKYDPASLAVVILAGSISFVTLVALLSYKPLRYRPIEEWLFLGWLLGALGLGMMLKTVEKSAKLPHQVPTYLDGRCGHCGEVVVEGWNRVQFRNPKFSCSCGSLLNRTGFSKIPLAGGYLFLYLLMSFGWAGLLSWAWVLGLVLFFGLVYEALLNPLQVIALPGDEGEGDQPE